MPITVIHGVPVLLRHLLIDYDERRFVSSIGFGKSTSLDKRHFESLEVVRGNDAHADVVYLSYWQSRRALNENRG
jgi:hypothetical protein